MNKASLLILGFINKQPQSAYDMVKKIDDMGINSLFPCGESTIYIYSKKLLAKNLIEKSDTKTTGKKTIYQITESGKKALSENVEKITSQYQMEDSGFSIAVIFLDIFSKEKKCELMEKRILSVKESLEYLARRKVAVEQEEGLPSYHTQCIGRLIAIAEGELEGCSNLLKLFQGEGKV